MFYICLLYTSAYGTGLFPEDVVPVKKAGDVYVTELFQGPTAAFKDMALSLLPYFMTFSLKQKGEEREVMILAATSGAVSYTHLGRSYFDYKLC